jgi:hypothetical protein
MSEDEIKHQWQIQPAALPQLEIGELLGEASAFQRRIARRNLREYAAGATIIPVFCFYIWLFPYWVTRLGSALIVLGTLVLMWQLHRRAASRAMPEDLGANCLQFQRSELTRQRDAVRSVWLWYLGPLLPGLVVFMWGMQGGSAKPFELVVDLIMAAVFVVIIWINQRAAAKLQRRINELDTLVEPKATESA